MQRQFLHVAFAQIRKISGKGGICTKCQGRVDDSQNFPQLHPSEGRPMSKPVPPQSANQMWGGRFAEGPDAIMTAINASIGFDKRLYAQDIAGSRAHAAMLAATGILTNSDAEAIGEGLLTVLSEIEAGKFPFRVELEDIHLNIEARLTELVGRVERGEFTPSPGLVADWKVIG
jgi:hypothetical protein